MARRKKGKKRKETEKTEWQGQKGNQISIFLIEKHIFRQLIIAAIISNLKFPPRDISRSDDSILSYRRQLSFSLDYLISESRSGSRDIILTITDH